jgi:zinc transporter ZupT
MSDSLKRNTSYLFGFLGVAGICIAPFVSICMGNKYDVQTFSKIFWPVSLGFVLYIISYALYPQPNDPKYENVLLVFICGSVLFSLSAITLINLRQRYAA